MRRCSPTTCRRCTKSFARATTRVERFDGVLELLDALEAASRSSHRSAHRQHRGRRAREAARSRDRPDALRRVRVRVRSRDARRAAGDRAASCARAARPSRRRRCDRHHRRHAGGHRLHARDRRARDRGRDRARYSVEELAEHDPVAVFADLCGHRRRHAGDRCRVRSSSRAWSTTWTMPGVASRRPALGSCSRGASRIGDTTRAIDDSRRRTKCCACERTSDICRARDARVEGTDSPRGRVQGS